MSKIDMNQRVTYLVLFALAISMLLASCGRKVSLFSGDSSAWRLVGDARWQIGEEEVLGKVNDGAGYLVSKASYDNFILEVDFKPDPTINSGVFIRCNSNDINPDNCYELNIWDAHTNLDNRTGAVVRRMKPLAHVETVDKWNNYKIEARGNHLKVWIDGVLTADLVDDALSTGHIGLQAKGTGEIRFKNIKLKELKK